MINNEQLLVRNYMYRTMMHINYRLKSTLHKVCPPHKSAENEILAYAQAVRLALFSLPCKPASFRRPSRIHQIQPYLHCNHIEQSTVLRAIIEQILEVTGFCGDGSAVIQISPFSSTEQYLKSVGFSGSGRWLIRGLSAVCSCPRDQFRRMILDWWQLLGLPNHPSASNGVFGLS
jgi:hypothetical protein